MSDHWDVYLAEYRDTERGNYKPKRPCVYCGIPTTALSQVCCAHTDLMEVDAGYPAAVVDETDATPSPGAAGRYPTARKTASVSSTTANGDRP